MAPLEGTKDAFPGTLVTLLPKGLGGPAGFTRNILDQYQEGLRGKEAL